MSTPATDELAARRPRQESRNRTRWMLWLDHITLAALKRESDVTGQPMAAIVREVTDARTALDAEQVAAYTAEAARRRVPVSEVYRDALVNGCPARAAAPAVAA